MIRFFERFKQFVDKIKLKLWSENRHTIFKSKDINVGDGSSYSRNKYGSTKIVNKNQYNRSNYNMSSNLDSYDELQYRKKYYSLKDKGYENLTEEEKCLFRALEDLLDIQLSVIEKARQGSFL